MVSEERRGATAPGEPIRTCESQREHLREPLAWRSDGRRSRRSLWQAIHDRRELPRFRDAKDLHFGLGLSATHIRDATRRDRFMLLLAMTVPQYAMR